MSQNNCDNGEWKEAKTWICYNFMAIEKGILPQHLADKFVELMSANTENITYQKCFEKALAILKYTDITDKQIMSKLLA